MTSDKFINFAKKELIKLQNSLILRDQKKVHLFNRYKIYKAKLKYWAQTPGTDPLSFPSLKTAASWCVADNAKQQILAQEIYRLSTRSLQLAESIRTRYEILNITNSNTMRQHIEAKIFHRKNEKHTVDCHLEKCVIQAKYIQFKGFNNDTR